ncbi:MAG: D-hexose-6-phosphate mutarotase, partial [Planctomycetes bacterium]|nr:D-hexose-6-phosphate mutarotase [Planctomycetota bacterium]
MTINELTEQFAVENVAKFEAVGDLTDIVIASPGGEARICLQGAHVTHWRPAGDRPVLWMSEKTLLEKGKAIRGGIPVCFPWFGPRRDDPQAPPHGFARLMEWSVESISEETSGCVKAALVLKADETTKKYWPGQFELRLVVTVAKALTMTLETKNVGAEAFTITEALHTYLAVSDCRNVTITGLENTEYLDKVD